MCWLRGRERDGKNGLRIYVCVLGEGLEREGRAGKEGRGPVGSRRSAEGGVWGLGPFWGG